MQVLFPEECVLPVLPVLPVGVGYLWCCAASGDAGEGWKISAGGDFFGWAGRRGGGRLEGVMGSGTYFSEYLFYGWRRKRRVHGMVC